MEMEMETSDLFPSIARELGDLASRIPTLAGSEGSFVADITDLLHQCVRASQEAPRDGYGHTYFGRLIYDIGFHFNSCLEVSRTYKHPLSGHKLKLYTTFRTLSQVPVVMYPRNWYEELRNTRILDAHLKVLMENVCRLLWNGNIVLFISPEDPTSDPPWLFDDLLGKRLADNDLPRCIDNYEWALSTSLLPSISLPEHSQGAHRQESTAKGSLGGVYAASSGREKPHHTSRTSDTGAGLQMTKAFQISCFDAMDIDWNPGDNLLGNSQAGWLPQISRPTVMEAEPQSKPPPAIRKLVPSQGSVKGGIEVTLLGNGFYQGLEVIFGDTEATATTFWGDRCLVCEAPPAVKAGYVTIRFKQESHHQNATQQQLPFPTCVYEYIDDQESSRYGHALTALEHNLQHSGGDAQSTPRQQITGVSTTTTPTTLSQQWSSVMWNNFALITHWAGCLATHTAPFLTTENYVLELSHQSLVSLRHALAVLPLEDDTILCAILLWLVEEFRHREDDAKLHWDVVKVLVKRRPDFDIKRVLVRFSYEASSALTNQQSKSVAEVNNYIAAHFITTMEDTTTSENVAQSAAPSAAPTPAATVYSPWSETDVDPPPYMLSPTPLKQACLIYAAVNAGRKEIRIT